MTGQQVVKCRGCGAPAAMLVEPDRVGRDRPAPVGVCRACSTRPAYVRLASYVPAWMAQTWLEANVKGR